MQYNTLLKIYYKIEKFAKEKPFLFWFVTTVIVASVPLLISFWERIKNLLKKDFFLKGYEILLIFLAPIIILIIFKIFKPSAFKKGIIRELFSLKTKLDNPFEIERTTFKGTQKFTEKFYHYEILECFDNYNAIITKIKNKWPNKFDNLNLREEKPTIHEGDWVPISYMQVIKSDVISLIRRIK